MCLMENKREGDGKIIRKGFEREIRDRVNDVRNEENLEKLEKTLDRGILWRQE